MRKLPFILLISLSFTCRAQYTWDFGVHTGVSNYLGEIGGGAGPRRDFVSDIKLSKTQFTLGGFARYKVDPLVSVKLGLSLVRVGGNDNASTNPGRVGRNLSFRNDILELDLVGQIFFFEIPDLGKTYRYRNDFKMYAFAGIAGFYNNPKAHYYGEWVALQPLETEGIKYSKFQVSIPAGIGMFFTLQKRHRIGWEFNWRTTFTDYIDDVSTVYADPSTLKSQEAIALANRRGDLGTTPGVPGAENYKPGNKRGDPSHNDSYLSTSVYYSYVMRGKSSFYRSKHGSVFKRKKYKKHRIHATF